MYQAVGNANPHQVRRYQLMRIFASHALNSNATSQSTPLLDPDSNLCPLISLVSYHHVQKTKWGIVADDGAEFGRRLLICYLEDPGCADNNLQIPHVLIITCLG